MKTSVLISLSALATFALAAPLVQQKRNEVVASEAAPPPANELAAEPTAAAVAQAPLDGDNTALTSTVAAVAEPTAAAVAEAPLDGDNTALTTTAAVAAEPAATHSPPAPSPEVAPPAPTVLSPAPESGKQNIDTTGELLEFLDIVESNADFIATVLNLAFVLEQLESQFYSTSLSSPSTVSPH